MTRKQKDQFIDTLSEKLSDKSNFYLIDISGLSVSNSNELRKLFFNNGMGLKVVKNTLLKKAMEKAQGDYQFFYETLKGNTAIIFTEHRNVPAKLIKQYRKKYDKPLLKAANIDETLYLGDEQLTILSDLKSKNEIIADIICLLQSPVKNVISSLHSGGNILAGIVKTLSEKKQ